MIWCLRLRHANMHTPYTYAASAVGRTNVGMERVFLLLLLLLLVSARGEQQSLEAEETRTNKILWCLASEFHSGDCDLKLMHISSSILHFTFFECRPSGFQQVIVVARRTGIAQRRINNKDSYSMSSVCSSCRKKKTPSLANSGQQFGPSIAPIMSYTCISLQCRLRHARHNCPIFTDKSVRLRRKQLSEEPHLVWLDSIASTRIDCLWLFYFSFFSLFAELVLLISCHHIMPFDSHNWDITNSTSSYAWTMCTWLSRYELIAK